MAGLSTTLVAEVMVTVVALIMLNDDELFRATTTKTMLIRAGLAWLNVSAAIK